jgi:hypothetical protein
MATTGASIMSLLPSPASVSFSYISPQIAQGSRPPAGSWLRENGFTAVVFAAHEYQPEDRYYPGVVIVRASLDDSGAPMSNREWSDALRASAFVSTLVKKDHMVYVSCWMGQNRSGLISALAVHRLTGISGRRAADHVRKHRPHALTNPSFSAALDALPAARPRVIQPSPAIVAPEPHDLAFVQGAYAMRGGARHG